MKLSKIFEVKKPTNPHVFPFPTKGAGGFYEFLVDTNIPKEK